MMLYIVCALITFIALVVFELPAPSWLPDSVVEVLSDENSDAFFPLVALAAVVWPATLVAVAWGVVEQVRDGRRG